MTPPKQPLRILTNMAFWQSPDFAQATDSIYDLDTYKQNPSYRSQRWEAWQLFKRRKNYDVIHTMNIRASMFYALLCKLTRSPAKQIMTEVFFDPAQPQHWKWRLKTALYRWVSQNCWGVITNSSDEITVTQQRLRLPLERIIFLPLYTNIRHPHIEPQRNGIILSAGRSLRDYDTLLAAAPQVNAPIHIICGAHDLQNTPLPGNITLMRERPYNEYIHHIKTCSLVVLPLIDTVRSTGQVVMLTAMGLGKPVITTDSPGTRDYLRTGENGILIPPKDPTALADAVNHLLAQPQQAEKMADAALQDINEKYTIDQHGQQRLRIIHQLYQTR